MRLYVGNLPYSVETDHLRALFGTYGEVRDGFFAPNVNSALQIGMYETDS